MAKRKSTTKTLTALLVAFAMMLSGFNTFVATASSTVAVIFNLDGGTIDGNPANPVIHVTFGQSISNTPGIFMPSNVMRPGHTFLGWQTEFNEPFTAETIVTAQMVVRAIWAPNPGVAITFNLSGGTINNSSADVVRNVVTGNSISNSTGVDMPENPTRSGFAFNGWLMPNGLPFTGDTAVNESMTVVAQWTAGNQVTFNLNGGTIGNNTTNPIRAVLSWQSINNTAGVSMPENPTRQGFAFAGWRMPNGQEFTGATIVNEPIVVTAQWAAGHQITFNLGGGTINNSTESVTRAVPNGQNINNTTGVSMPSEPVRQGFTFTGWRMPNGQEFTGDTVVNGPITATAQWTAGNQVTFNLNGGAIGNSTENPTRAVPNGQNINNTTGVSMPENPTRQGFTFDGWRTPNGQIFTGATVVNSSVTVTAQWTEGHQVTFNLNGGTIAGSATSPIRHIPGGQNINNTANVVMPPNPTRSGFTFNGWQMQNGQMFTSTTVVNGPISVTAQWVVAQSPGAPLVNQVISMGADGSILVGTAPFAISSDLGRFHINSDGVSVLPARAVLSILFGADPHDPDLFIWHANISTFVIDPQGHNIRIQVGNETMHVGGAPRTILSGQGATAFPYAAYVDPADSRLYVPVRAIAEAVGFTVEWNPATSTVTLVPPAQ